MLHQLCSVVPVAKPEHYLISGYQRQKVNEAPLGVRRPDRQDRVRIPEQEPAPRFPASGDNSLLRMAPDKPAIRSESSDQKGLLQKQFLHSFGQVLVIDLEDNLKAII